jgi:hypothetical protein
MLILSGGALAAESGADTTSQPVSQTAVHETTIQNTTVSNDGKAAVVNVTVSVPADSSTAPATPTPVAAAPKTAETAPASAPGGLRKQATVKVASTVAPTPAEPTPVAVAPEAPKPVVATAASVTPDTQKPAEQIAAPAPVDAPQKGIVYKSRVLPIQPIITTSHPVAINDLAAAVPTAAPQQEPAKAPVPSQPNGGVLGLFTAQLAGAVVPSIVLSPDHGFSGLAAILTLLTLVALFVAQNLVTTFGARLRRGGYAHAARSDVAVATFNTFFATPFSLSYVKALPPERSSFLMVSESTNLFPTLSERRK